MKAKNKRRKQDKAPVVALTIGVVVIIGFIVFSAYQSNKMAEQRRLAQELLRPNEFDCISSPVSTDMAGIERVPCKSQAHEGDASKQIEYETDPPFSGEHYGTPTNAGFYTDSQAAGNLVHSLEHGLVVIYYNEALLSEVELEAVRDLTKKYRGTWDGVVAVPRADPDHALILTAWEHGLRLKTYDAAPVEQFVDLFRGRGPENPVRPLG